MSMGMRMKEMDETADSAVRIYLKVCATVGVAFMLFMIPPTALYTWYPNLNALEWLIATFLVYVVSGALSLGWLFKSPLWLKRSSVPKIDLRIVEGR